MIRRWQIPTYVSKFIKKEPGDHFEQLLTDEGGVNYKHPSFKFSKKDRIKEAKKRLSKAKDQVQDYITEKENEVGSSTGQSAGDTIMGQLVDASTKGMELQYASHALELISQAELLVNEAEEVQITTEWSVLCSTWLQAGIATFNTGKGMPSEELQELVTQLITQLSILLGQIVYVAFPLGGPLFLVKDALVLISNLPQESKEGTVGNLTITICKRYNPIKVYGPYTNPNVPSWVWEIMQTSKKAGTDLWNYFLHGFYSKRIIPRLKGGGRR